MGWLDGKVALVVGGGSGIGRAVVEDFLREGARVGVLEIDDDKCRELGALDPNVVAVGGDATSLDDNRAAVEAVSGSFGRLDVMATFVGLFDHYTPLSEIPDEVLPAAFAEMFTTNVQSYLLSAKAAINALKESRGNIVFTVSTSGFYPGRGGALYVSSKFAVRGLVAQLAHELAPEIRVNGVAPGGTLATDLRGLDSLSLGRRRLADIPNRSEELKKRTPLEIAMTPEDHAGAYVFLASDKARGITGIIINSDGGIGIRG